MENKMLDKLAKKDIKEIWEKFQNAETDYLLIEVSVFNTGHCIRVAETDNPEIDYEEWNGYDFILEHDYYTEKEIEELL